MRMKEKCSTVTSRRRVLTMVSYFPSLSVVKNIVGVSVIITLLLQVIYIIISNQWCITLSLLTLFLL